MLSEAENLFTKEYKKLYAGYYHLTLGKNYHQLASNDKAQYHYHKAIKALESKSTKADYEKKWLGSAYYNLYTLFSYTDPEFSQYEFLQKALEIYREINYKTGLSNCYNSMARIYFNKQDYKTALEYLHTSSKILEAEGSNNVLPTVYSNIGLTYARLLNKEKGIEYVLKGLELAKAQKNPVRIIHAYEKLAEVYVLQKDYDAALQYLKSAEQLADKLKAKKYLSGIYKNLVHVYEKMHDYKGAHTYDLLYIELILDNFKEEKAQAILQARSQFDMEKKELENLLLKQKTEDIEKYAAQLKAYNDELSQFTYVTSHHLREPLRTITTYTALLERSLKTRISGDEKEFMQFISSASKTMYNLLGGLIALSNIHVPNQEQTADITSILLTVKKNLAAEIESKKAVIKHKILPVIKADATQLEIVLQNLISNAIKFNTSTKPYAEIRYEKINSKHVFRVSDNGIGIPSEYHDKIFMIFERLHQKDEFSGTGMGLAICKKIIDNMQGDIRVETNNRQGSDFIFSIPAL